MISGDLKPDFRVEIGDGAGQADFSTLAPANVRLQMVYKGDVVIDDTVDSVDPSEDGTTAIISRAWDVTETDITGTAYWSIMVLWPGAKPQHFPGDSMGEIQFRNKPGQA